MKYLWTALLLALTLVPVATAIGSVLPIDPSMVVYYRFNNNASVGENLTYVYDWTGNNNSAGVIAGASFNSTGGFLQDGAYNYNANGSYIQETRSNSSTNVTDNVSLSFWFNTNILNATQYGLAGRSTSSTRWSYGCFISTANALNCQINNVSSTLVTLNAGTISTGRWYYVVLTYASASDATTNNVNLYVNGILNQSSNASKGQLTTSGQGLTFGRWGASSANYFNGSIDEGIMYNRVINKDEVWNNYMVYNYCLTPVEGLVLRGNTTLCPGNYNLNSTTSGIFNLGNNIVLEGSGVNLTGNYSSGGATNIPAIFTFQNTNVTIQNLTISNYYYGIKEQSNNGNILTNNRFTNNYQGVYYYVGNLNNSVLKNNYFLNNSFRDVGIDSTGQSRLQIYNNLFDSYSQGIYEENGVITSNVYIYNNTFNLFTTGRAVKQSLGNNWSIYNNTVNGPDLLFSYSFDIRGTNTTIYNNFISYTQYGILVQDATNISLNNNTVINGDIGSTVSGSNFVTVSNNTFTNITQDYDVYNLGLKIFETNNTVVTGNTFNEVASAGIAYQGSYNAIITNNTFRFIPLQNRTQYLATDRTDLPCAIKLVQLYKSFFYTFGNSNITVGNNSYDQYTQCYVQVENGSSISVATPAYWTANFATPTVLKGFTTVYLSLLFNDISRYQPASGAVNNIYSNFNGGDKPWMQYYLFKQYLLFQNINSSTDFQTNVYNLTNALVYYDNNSIACQRTTTCNVNLSYLQYIVVLDYYNITLGQTRSYDPVSVVAPTSYSFGLTSGLTNNITNVSVTVYTSTTPNSPNLVHASTGITENITSYTYNSGSGAFTFNATLTTGLNTLLIDSSPTSPPVIESTACQNASSSISTFANWLTLLAIVLVVGIVLYVLYGVYSGSLVIDAGVIIKAGVGLIIAGIFIVIGVIIVAGAASTCV